MCEQITGEGKGMEKFEDYIASVLDTLRLERKFYESSYLSQDVIKAGLQLIQVMKDTDEKVQEAVWELFKKEIPYERPYTAVWVYSMLIKIKHDSALFYEFVRYARENRTAFSNNTQYYLWSQLSHMQFRYPALYEDKTNLELWRFFLEIVDAFASEVAVSLEEIPESERDENLVLVIVSQYVLNSHAPTVTALDRCFFLQEKLKKKILIINTGEALNVTGCIPLAEVVVGNNEDLRESGTVNWKGKTFPYFQCPEMMPDIDVINLVLEQVRQLKPGRVLLIGGVSVLGNIIDRIIPALTLALVFSDLTITGTRYQAVGRKLTEEDEKRLKKVGFKRSHVIESTFTFDIKPQTEVISRQELGIPEDAFVLVTVGTRLESEIMDDFLGMLESILNEKIVMVFIGDFPGYTERIKQFSVLGNRSMALGSCQDVLSRLQVCDLYVNPKRKGGGSSVVEAMYLGKPAVSIAYGDIAVNAGEEFTVDTYEEMKAQILHYCNDKDFYAEMSKKAKKRADILLDTETAFSQIMEEYDRREKGR